MQNLLFYFLGRLLAQRLRLTALDVEQMSQGKQKGFTCLGLGQMSQRIAQSLHLTVFDWIAARKSKTT